MGKHVAALALAILCLASCDQLEDIFLIKHEVVFSASTKLAGTVETKTNYSGEDAGKNRLSNTSDWERIDWERTDRIRILCQQAQQDNSDVQTIDYIVMPDPSDKSQSASLTPTNDTGIKWGKGTHYFYALYPAESMNNGREMPTVASIVSNGMNGVTVKGTIPAVQNVIKDGSKYTPSMNYAYMYACAKTDSKSDCVNLEFKSLITAMEFTFRTEVRSMTESDLIELTIISDDKPLAGDFMATLSPSGLEALTMDNVSNATNEINIVFPSGIRLSSLTDTKISVLTLPFNQSGISIELSFQNGYTQRLAFEKEDGADICCEQGKKTRFTNCLATGYEYYFEVSCPHNTINNSGDALEYVIYSCKYNNQGPTIDMDWSADFSVDDGNTWSQNAPSWLTITPSGKGYADCVLSATPNSDNSEWSGATQAVASSSSSAYDLSLHDIYGNSHSQTTANCYVVSAPGWYKFPLIYGNAIKDGGDNKRAYMGPDAGSGVMAGGFLNHAGTHITAPWLKDNGVVVKKAALLWQDVQGMIPSVEFDQNYIYFFVSPERISQGNALLAAMTEDETIVWSWHIWVMDNPTSTLATKTVYPYANASTVSSNEMMLMNLGCVKNGANSRSVMIRFTQDQTGLSDTLYITQAGKSYYSNPFYQWGRKDPLLCYYSEAMGFVKPAYDRDNQLIVKVPTSMAGTTVQRAINEPMRVALTDPENQHDWCSERYDNLWNSAQMTAVKGNEDADKSVYKTIYDPCPPGFKVPNGHAFSGFIKTGKKMIQSESEISASNNQSMWIDQGFHFYTNPRNEKEGTIFFPALITHDLDTYESGYFVGDLHDRMPLSGDYWTAEPCWFNSCQYSAFSMDFEGIYDWADLFFAMNQPRCACLSIRPVKE